MEEDGKFVVDDQPYDLTALSARSLLGKLDIPPSFALKTCPRDLAVQNINRMMQERKTQTVTCWGDPSNHTLLNVTEGDFAPIQHLSFLEAFADAFGAEGAHEVRMGAAELRVVRLFELKKDPVPGDFFQFGVEFSNYDVFSERHSLNAGAFLFRLVCRNGAKANDLVADYSRFFKPPVNEIYLRDQIKQIALDQGKAEDIVSTLRWMTQHAIGSNRTPLFKAFRKTAGKSLPLPKEVPFAETDTYYDVFNHITQAIQNPAMVFGHMLHVEAWAGSMVSAFSSALKSGETLTNWNDLRIRMN